MTELCTILRLQKALSGAGAAVAAVLLALLIVPPAEATVGQARTAGPDYDRNPSVVQDGALTYLFFARSQTPCNRLGDPPCNPDVAQYDLYLKTSSDGGKTYGLAQLVATNPDGAGPFFGRTIAATRAADGTVFVFWASGGNQQQLYYVRELGTGGFSPAAMPVVNPGLTDVFNVEAVTRGSDVLLYTEESEASTYGVHARTFSEPTASAATLVEADRNIPKAIVDSAGVVRMTYVDALNYPTVDVYVESSLDGLTWAQAGQLVVSKPGVSNWDPNLIQKPNGQYYLHFAPDAEQGAGRQEIALTKSNDFVRWTAAHEISPGFTGGTEYWDYWPEGFIRGNQVVLYYTSERGFDSFPTGIGHIWTDPGFGGLDGNAS
jgi:hypothetical protein